MIDAKRGAQLSANNEGVKILKFESFWSVLRQIFDDDCEIRAAKSPRINLNSTWVKTNKGNGRYQRGGFAVHLHNFRPSILIHITPIARTCTDLTSANVRRSLWNRSHLYKTTGTPVSLYSKYFTLFSSNCFCVKDSHCFYGTSLLHSEW